MSAPASLPPPARSWRDIPQSVAPVAMSREGRKRHRWYHVKLGLSLAGLALSLWGGYTVYEVWSDDPRSLKAPVKAAPVRAISVRTDGVLTQDWVKTRLALPKDADLMALDLFQLRERLVSHAQVRNAVVTRRFPDTVAVVIEERTPVARIRAQSVAGDTLTYCVARDGFVFEGVNQSEDLLATLPVIEGTNLRRVGRGYEPLDGMQSVSDLLQTAQTEAPHLYRDWKTVQLAQLRSDGLIRVKTGTIPDVVFGVRDDFLKQLAQLDLVIDQLKVKAPHLPVKTVNLAVGLSANGIQVPISFAEIQEVPAGEEPPPAPVVLPKAPSIGPRETPAARGTAYQNSPSIRFPRSTSL